MSYDPIPNFQKSFQEFNVSLLGIHGIINTLDEVTINSINGDYGTVNKKNTINKTQSYCASFSSNHITPVPKKYSFCCYQEINNDTKEESNSVTS